MDNWTNVLGLISSGCLVLLLVIGAWSLVNSLFIKNTVRSPYGGDRVIGLPTWAVVVAWVLAAAMVLSGAIAFVGKVYQHDHTPTPETVVVVMPVTTTDSGVRILQVRERHGIIVPLTCTSSECDGLTASSKILVDVFYDAEGKLTLENPRKA